MFSKEPKSENSKQNLIVAFRFSQKHAWLYLFRLSDPLSWLVLFCSKFTFTFKFKQWPKSKSNAQCSRWQPSTPRYNTVRCPTPSASPDPCEFQAIVKKSSCCYDMISVQRHRHVRGGICLTSRSSWSSLYVTLTQHWLSLVFLTCCALGEPLFGGCVSTCRTTGPVISTFFCKRKPVPVPFGNTRNGTPSHVSDAHFGSQALQTS